MSPLPARSPDTFVHLAGEMLQPLPQGALWWPDQRLLIVSDLHFEKGSAYAARGQMLPPYDTRATLTRIETLCDALAPRTVISLGDSFHDRSAELRLSEEDAARIRILTSRHDWLWIEGNHDPAPPAALGGRAQSELRLGALIFRHEPTGERGEVAGHLHPCARIDGRGQSVRRKCFISDGERLVLPAMGAFTGGLNVLDPAFAPLFPQGFSVFALGDARVYMIARRRLLSDDHRSPVWRL